MTASRDIRRCAVQAMYQMDAQRGSQEPTREMLLESLAESAGDSRTHSEGLALALRAWARRDEADQAIATLAPDWPTHRQPVIDRNILRLGYHEIVSGDAPPKVAINEAVELAREFSTDKSPAFVNGLLDKIMRQTMRRSNAAASKALEAE